MSKPVSAGSLRHRVTIEQLVVDLDSDGATQQLWQSFASGIPAEISALSGRELIAAQAVQAKVNTRIKVRYRPGILPSMRIRHRSDIYNIEAVIPDPDSRIRYMTLTCSSGVNAGGTALEDSGED